MQADLARGVPHEVRVKALRALPLLPGHRLEVLLGDGKVLERLVLSLRSANDAVRVAAIETAAELTARERTLQQAAQEPGTLSALIDLWEGVTDALTGGGRLPCCTAGDRHLGCCGGHHLTRPQHPWVASAVPSTTPAPPPNTPALVPLTDETDVVCANACAALAQLLPAADSQAVGGGTPLPDAAAAVLFDLTDTVHKRLGGLLGVALARFRALGTVLLVAVPPLLVAYLQGLSPLPEERRLDALPGDVSSGACGHPLPHSGAGPFCSAPAGVLPPAPHLGWRLRARSPALQWAAATRMRSARCCW